MQYYLRPLSVADVPPGMPISTAVALLRWKGYLFATILCVYLGGFTVPAPGQDTTINTNTDRFDVEHLVLTLDGTSLGQGAFEGEARYRLRAKTPSISRLQLWAADVSVEEAQLVLGDTTITELNFHQTDSDSLIVEVGSELHTDTTFELSILYRAETGPGLQIETQPDGSLDAVWTAGIPGTNRFWFPTFERLTDRFTSELQITLPRHLHVITSGEQMSSREQSSENETHHYRSSHPKPSHLIGFAAGIYESVRTSVERPTDEPVILEYLVAPERIGDARRTFSTTPAAIQFLGNRLGIPYPWSTYRQSVIPGIRPAGYQPPMTGILPDSIVIDQRAGIDFRADYEVVRTLARQWTDGLLTPKTWADAWILQGLSTFLALEFLKDSEGDAKALLRTLHQEQKYFSGPGALDKPLAPSEWEAPVDLLAPGRAAKAARVFQMLRHEIGEEAFASALQEFIADHRSEPVATADLRNTFETATDRSLKQFFEQWVFSSGHPVLEISYGFNPSVDSLSIHVRQRQDGTDIPPVFALDVPIVLHGFSGRKETTLSLREREEIVSIGLDSEPRFVEIDPENIVLDSTLIEQEASAWVRQTNEGQTVLSRIQAAREVRRFADHPSLPIGLRGALNRSSYPAVRAAILVTLGNLPHSESLHGLLVEASKSEAPEIRRASLVALRHTENLEQVRSIARQAAQNDRSYRVQATAIRTLAYVDEANAFGIIRSAFVTSSHNEVIRRAAFDALAILEPPLARGLPLALEWSNPKVPAVVRAAAPRYLVEHLDNSGARQRVAELLSDDKMRVRRATAEVLSRSSSPVAARLLEGRLEEERHPWVRQILRRSAAP